MDIQALLIGTDGTLTPVGLPADTSARLQTMYDSIGCTSVDVVALTNRIDMWLDDEGLYTQPINHVATKLAQRFGRTYQPYHGPVLITGGADNEGDTLPLDTDKANALLATLADL